MYNRLMSSVIKTQYINRGSGWFQWKQINNETATQAFLESIQQCTHRDINAIGMFLDLTKAQDIIYHDMLLYKVNSCGIRGTTHFRFKSQLAQQKLFDEINHSDSTNSIQKKYTSYKDMKY
jgi:hypothetical protein